MTGTDERRILVADDEEGVRRLIVRVLGRQGYTVVEATNGQEAWDCLVEEPVDLLITDLRMPDLDGQELLNRSRHLYPDMDVIVLTGYGTIQGAVYAMQRGALDYMTKPFGVAELEERVAECFRRRCERQSANQRSPIEPLVELNRILSGQTDVAAIMDDIIALVRRYFRPRDTELAVVENSPEALHLVASTVGTGRASHCPLPSLGDVERLARAPEPWLLCDADSGRERGAQAGSILTVPLVSGEEVLGTLTLIERAEEGRYSRDDGQLLYLFGCQIALALQHTRTRRRLWDAFRDLEQATLSTVQTLFEALAVYDPYTHEHSQRVARYARLLGGALGLPDRELESLSIAALLHDVGKFGISDETLHKAGTLTSDELDRVRLHPVMGARILAGMGAFRDIVPMVRHHHEWYDGSGYPDGLVGDDIPLGARVLAVVDSFDSMTSDRPYRKALSMGEAVARLRASSGSQLDADLAERWIALLEDDGLSAGDTPHAMQSIRSEHA